MNLNLILYAFLSVSSNGDSDSVDTEYIDAVVDIENVLFGKEVTLVEEIKFNSKRIVIL